MQCLGEFVLADVQSKWMRLQVCIEKWSPQKCGAESDSGCVYTFVLGLFKILFSGVLLHPYTDCLHAGT